MGRKKSDEKANDNAADTKEEVEDTPLVKELKELDDKYLALEREYEKDRQELKVKYDAKQQPMLDSRTTLLMAAPEDGEAETGTPALPGFWRKALQNHPAFEDQIEEWDEPVLEYLSDISAKDLDEKDSNAGFVITFKFAPNPYFTNETLVKECKTEEDSPYTGDINVKEVKCTEIDWKTGKDVTIEKVAKKVKGGGAKKAKQKGKETTEPRESFFRSLFRNLSEGMDLPDDIDLEGMGVDEDEDENEILEYLMENDHEAGMAIRDSIIPYAVRWYTGEAAPERDDDDEDEEEDSDEDEEDDDDSEDEPPKRKGGAGKKGGKPKSSPKGSPEMKPKDKEECKQQ